MNRGLLTLALGYAITIQAMGQDIVQPRRTRSETIDKSSNDSLGRVANAPKPEAAIPAVLQLFDKYQIVGLSDLHGCAELLALVDRLIRAPEFCAKVDDITWEPGNARFQSQMDDFILRGKEIPYKKLAQCWRNNTQVHTYSDTPTLFELLQTIRAVNRTQPESRRVRVLLIDPPVDWSTIQTAEDIRERDFDRETHMAEVLEREVYAKGRKALFFAGGAHLSRGASPLHALEQRHPGTTYNIAIHIGFGGRNEELEKRLVSWPKPALAGIRGTWWGELQPPPTGDVFIHRDGTPVLPRPDLKIQDKWDAVLFLGKRRDLTRVDPPGANVLDAEWINELRRRKAILGGRMPELSTNERPHTRQFFPDDSPQRDQMIRIPFDKATAGPTERPLRRTPDRK
jgi:hypothetical protein